MLGPGTATVDSELVLWNGTTGTSIKRAAFSGLVKSTAGVASAAVAGTDYVTPSGSITGNAATATALQTARTINGTSFNGTANITTSLWGTSRTVTIGGTGKAVDGSANVSWSLAEIGAQAADADLTAIAALAGTSGLLRKTAADTWSLDTSAYITGNQTITFSGDATGSGTTAVTLTLANSGVTSGTYRSVTVDAKGRVTAGTNPTTLAGYGITDAAPLASPALTGTPTAPTAAGGTNTTQIATTAFVTTAVSTKANTASPALTGTPTAPTAAAKDATTQIATDAFVDRLRSFLTGITSGTPTTADRGCLLQVTAGITLPASVLAAGDTFSIYNNSAANITLTQGSGLTLRLGGTATTGNRTLAQRGIATVVFISATEAVIGGMGLT